MKQEKIIFELLLEKIKVLEERVSKLESEREANLEEETVGESKKYRYLANYLKESNKSRVSLRFEEIEKIIGFKLPNSARNHRAYWSNSTSHSIALSWMSVNYETVEVNLTKEFVVFEKI